jgi:hypothetical protein
MAPHRVLRRWQGSPPPPAARFGTSSSSAPAGGSGEIAPPPCSSLRRRLRGSCCCCTRLPRRSCCTRRRRRGSCRHCRSQQGQLGKARRPEPRALFVTVYCTRQEYDTRPLGGVVFAFAGVKHAARVMAPQHHLHGEHRRRHAAPVQRVQGGGDPGGLAQLHPHTPLVMRILLFEKSLSYHQVQFPSLLLSCRTPIWLLIEHIIR